MGGKANEETRKRLEKKIKPDPVRPKYPDPPSTLPFYKWLNQWGKPLDPENIAEPENKGHQIGIDSIPFWGAKAVFDYYMKWGVGNFYKHLLWYYLLESHCEFFHHVIVV